MGLLVQARPESVDSEMIRGLELLVISGDPLFEGLDSRSQILEPIPVFGFNASIKISPTFEDRLLLKCWRYIITSLDERPTSLDVEVIGQENSIFGGIASGRAVTLLQQAIILAEREYLHSGHDYQISVLEVPNRKLSALMLSAKSDRKFIPYLSAGLMDGDELHILSELEL